MRRRMIFCRSIAIVGLLILFLPPICGWAQQCSEPVELAKLGPQMLGSVPAGGESYLCGGGTTNCASYSDAFADITAWTNEAGDDNNFAPSGGQITTDYASGSYRLAVLRYNSATNTISQFNRFLIVNVGYNSDSSCGSVFRSASDGTGYRYTIEKENFATAGTCYFNEYNGVTWGRSIQSAACSIAEGEYMCAVVIGTGDSAVASIWRNCSNAVPRSSGANCTDTGKPCWDSAGDTPDLQLSGAITNEQNTQKGLGLLGFSGGSVSEQTTLDTWSGGDVPD